MFNIASASEFGLEFSKNLGSTIREVEGRKDGGRFQKFIRWDEKAGLHGIVTLPMIDVLLSTRKGDRR